jgi:ribosomal protein S18 acetylase RimI-like enzyme
MALDFQTDIPSAEQFSTLFETTGWNEEYRLSPDRLIDALRASWYTLSVYDHGRLIGFGRIVTDLVMHAMIYDLIVIPEYQGRGIGSQILMRLMERCREAGVHDIQLFSARGKRGFYEKHGFEARPDDGPGMQYRI